jgi:peptidoglycan/LPS O-acetylase OafA/YrhL
MEIRPAAPARAFVTPEQRRERRRVDPPRPRRVGPPPAERGRLISRSLRGHVESGFRPDVEGMRAIAVLAVVLYHFDFPLISGGFVGVDVFFVLSGFLITRLVLGELVGTGTISLPAFWGRRARRLLPASAAVVVVTVLIATQVLPPLRLRELAGDTVGAATFTANFRFADSFGDYFDGALAKSNPSPLLHFWSLAVEEQFYLCWPPLLLLLARRPREYRRLVLATVGLVAVASFVLGIWLTSRNQAAAFYLLPARMGELLAGAALAIVGAGIMGVPALWRAAAGWAGLAGIVLSCLAFSDSTPWPGGLVLVPVVATMFVIVGAPVRSVPWSAGRYLSAPTLQWVGRHSYALYLWHWPLKILAEAHTGPLSWPERIVIIGIAVALSVLSVQVLEDPIRHSRWLSAVAPRSLALGAAMCVLVLAVGWNLRSAGGELSSDVAAEAPELDLAATAGSAPVADAAAVTVVVAPSSAAMPAVEESVPATEAVAETTLATADPPSGSLGRLVASTQRLLAGNTGAIPVPSNLTPSLSTATKRSRPYDDGCVNVGTNARLQPCEYGTAGSERTILLYGDSHAVQWFEPLEQIATARGYRLVILIKAGCPAADVDTGTPNMHYTCPPYRDAAISWIAANEPDLVVVSNSYTQYPADAEEWAVGTEETVERLAEASSNVVVFGDNPAFLEDPPICLSDHIDDASACAVAREDAVRQDRISAEVVATRNHDVAFVDTTDWFCTDDVCPPVVGNVLVMRDETHITVPMALFLQPLVEAAIAPVLS